MTFDTVTLQAKPVYFETRIVMLWSYSILCLFSNKAVSAVYYGSWGMAGWEINGNILKLESFMFSSCSW